MSKTLVIAEKPSVGRDIARVLPGPFTKGEGYLEGPEHVITWAVGHLVQLADPDEYDDKFKKWRMADLPIVPEQFKLVVRDERSKKQMNVIKRQLGRDDVDEVVNACDAGREGELIFAYVYEKAGRSKPVQRLWLNSMTNAGDQGRVRLAAPGAELRAARAGRPLALGGRLDRRHERDPRRHDPAALVLRRRRLARPRADADARDPGAPRGGDPGFRARALLAGRRDVPRRALPGGDRRRVLPGRCTRREPAPRRPPRRRDAVVARLRGQVGEDHEAREAEQRERAPLLYDLTSLQREANTRYGFTAARTLAAAQRLYEEHKALTYPRTNSRYLTSDMIGEIKPIAGLVGERAEYAAAEYVIGLDVLPLGRVVNDAKVTDHHAIIPTNAEPPGRQDERRRPARSTTWSSGASWRCSTPRPCSRTRAWRRRSATHMFRTRGKLMLVPGLARRVRRDRGRRATRRARTTRAPSSGCRG